LNLEFEKRIGKGSYFWVLLKRIFWGLVGVWFGMMNWVDLEIGKK